MKVKLFREICEDRICQKIEDYASRGSARMHALAELDRAICGHREDAEVVTGGVGHQQVGAVARQGDGTLQLEVRRTIAVAAGQAKCPDAASKGADLPRLAPV
jgi:hypothetical protein